jgi:hypothetical protein
MTPLVFGFAPGALIRIIVRAFRRDDPRRRELLGEVYNVPFLQRPFWVAQQLEVALFDGIRPRLGKAIRRYNARERIARELREYKHDILHGSATYAEQIVAYSLMLGVPVYVLVYLHPSREGLVVAFVLWAAFMEARAYFYQRYKKQCEQADKPKDTCRFDVSVFLTLAPVVYVVTGYSFVHDMLVLISGNFSGGYWTGLFVSLIALWVPWNYLYMAKLNERIRSTSSLHPAEQQSSGNV